METMTDREKLDEVDRLRKEADRLITEAKDRLLTHRNILNEVGELRKESDDKLAAAAVFRRDADANIADANRNIGQASLLMREITGDTIN